MKKLIITNGSRFGRLLVIAELPKIPESPSRRILCECDCGNTVVTSPNSLTSGNTKSCGCFFKDKHRLLKTTHGKSLSRFGLYTRWRNMKKRCYNSKDYSYRWYGAKGIFVCEEWRHSFSSFEQWSINNGFKKGLTLDRIDSLGPYCPENCRWIEKSANSAKANIDSGRAKIITYQDRTLNALQWATILKIKPSTLHSRVFVLGWDIEKAFNTPPRYKKAKGE